MNNMRAFLYALMSHRHTQRCTTQGSSKSHQQNRTTRQPILLELLGYSSSNRIKTFYIEALNISARNLQTELVYVP
jgi:hypothetical protein